MGPFVLNGQVPSNARIFAWLAEYDPSTVRLVKDEREIPVVVEPAAVDVPGAYWVSPTELLSPGVYTISVTGPPAYPYETYFGTSGTLDNSAPLAAEARVLPIASHAYCEDIVGTSFYLNITPEYGTTLLFEVELFRAGELVEHTFTRGIFGTSAAPGCFGESHVEGLSEGDALTARARAWDSAGNVSGYVTFPFTAGRALAGSDRPCGRWCAATPGVPGGAMPTWAVVLVLLGGTRFAARRTHQTQSCRGGPFVSRRPSM